MYLSKNFELNELTRSATADRLGLTNEPAERAVRALRNLCVRTLQPLRDALGQPIHVNSGYRSPELNRAVGGVATSQHQKGEAADICHEGKASELLELLQEQAIPFDQAILYRRQNFLHVSLRLEGGQRGEIVVKG